VSRIHLPVRGAIEFWRRHLNEVRGQAHDALAAAQKQLESVDESLAAIAQAERELEADLARAAHPQGDAALNARIGLGSLIDQNFLQDYANVRANNIPQHVGTMLPLDKPKKEDA
jgi:hypothetical protein